MSWLRYMTLWSFRKFNPDWKMHLYLSPQTRHKKYWQDTPEQDFCHVLEEDWLPKVKRIEGLELHEWDLPTKELRERMGPSHRSNVFKWGTLAERGGVYADMDILFTSPMDPWYEEIAHADTAICYQHDTRRESIIYFLIGLLASAGDNACFAELWHESIEGFQQDAYQGAGALAIYRLLRPDEKLRDTLKSDLWLELTERHPELDFANFALSWIYPWLPARIHYLWSRRQIESELPKENVGIHWFAGNPFAQKSSRLLRPDNLKEHPSTMSHFLRKVLRA